MDIKDYSKYGPSDHGMKVEKDIVVSTAQSNIAELLGNTLCHKHISWKNC